VKLSTLAAGRDCSLIATSLDELLAFDPADIDRLWQAALAQQGEDRLRRLIRHVPPEQSVDVHIADNRRQLWLGDELLASSIKEA
jgi:hypothetical protein